MAAFLAIAGETTVILALVVASVIDLRDRLVPDSAAATVGIAGIIMNGIAFPRLAGYALAVSAVLFAVFLLMSSRQIIGGGDAKLLTAVSLAIPLPQLPTVFVAIGLAGGAVALTYLAAGRIASKPSRHRPADPDPEDRRISAAFKWLFSREVHRARRREPIPYAVAILIGVIWTYLS